MNRDFALILASGPTAKDFPVGLFRGKCLIITINTAYQLAPFANVYYACDHDWWKHWGESLRWLPGVRASLAVKGEPRYGLVDKYYQHLGRKGFSALGGIYDGQNSGYQAIQVAAHMGVKHVFLAGYDMGATGHTHFHGDHPTPLCSTNDFEAYVSHFRDQATEIKKHLHVNLVTAPSALSSIFDTITPLEALDELSAAQRQN